MSKQVIVYRKGEYLIEQITDDYTPMDIVLSFPAHASKETLTLKNFVKITCINPWSYNDRPAIIVKYRETLLDSTNGNMKQVFSSIIAFKDYTKKELDDLKLTIIEDKNKTTSLEKIINELNIEKKKLEQEVNRLKEVKIFANKIKDYTIKFLDVIESKE